MLLLFLIHMDLRTALTLWDRNACRFFDEEKVVKSSDWGGDNWSGSLSRSPLESCFWEQKKSWRERRSHQSQPSGQPCDRRKRVPLTVTLALQKVLPAALLALHR